MTEAVIVGAARTAIGNYGGALRDTPAVKLGSIAIKGAMAKARLRPVRDPQESGYAPDVFKSDGPLELEERYYHWDASLPGVKVDQVIMGNVLQAGQGQNVARQSAIYAGIPKEAPAYTANMICASGMKSVALADQAIATGDAEVVIAGGTENMSAAPYYLPAARWGARMFNTELVDGMVHDGLWEVFYGYHMGVTSENIAEKYAITRQQQDEFALMSHSRALQAKQDGVFREEIVPLEVKRGKEVVLFDADERPRETSLEALGKLSSVFKENGGVTAGNASGIADAAAALVVMSADKAAQLGLTPLAAVRAYAAAGVDPAYMGLGPVPAVRKALERAGLSLNDIDVIELNEAFASQAIAVMRELGLDIEKTNPHGSGISLGHPIGCTGARILVTLLHEMNRRDLRYGLATLCIGGGQGMAMILERE